MIKIFRIALATVVLSLAACGGGECDQSCQHTIDQAHGKATIQPPPCTPSAPCQE